MTRIVNSALLAGAPAELTPAERRKGERTLAKRRARNPLRRARLGCCSRWLLDPSARVGDWLWCDTDGDLGRVTEVAE